MIKSNRNYLSMSARDHVGAMWAASVVWCPSPRAFRAERGRRVVPRGPHLFKFT
jgi:hypothetical protein